MATTDLAVIEPGGFIALATDPNDVAEFIRENLGGADLTPRDLVQIKVPSGKSTKPRWEVPTLDGSEVVDELRGIIVHKQSTRQFWPRELGEGGGTGVPPSCSSPDAKVGFGKPWATADDLDPDGDPVRQACATCPHAQFASRGRGQACKQTEQMFLLMETGFLPAVVSAPAMSLAPFKKYMVGLSNSGLLYSGVVTTLGLEKDTNADGIDFAKITFKLGGHLSPAGREAVRTYAGPLRAQFEAIAVDLGDAGQPPAPPAPAPAAAAEPEESDEPAGAQAA